MYAPSPKVPPFGAPPVSAPVLAALAVLAAIAAAGPLSGRPPAPPLELPHPGGAPAPPAAFVPNAGQSDARVRFEARAGGSALFLTPRAVVLARATSAGAPPAVVRLRFGEAHPSPEITGLGRLPGIVNELRGRDPRRWRANLPSYGGAVYRDLYPGVDVRYGARGAGRPLGVNGTYALEPFADPGRIRWRYEGARDVLIDPATGSLRITPAGRRAAPLTEPAPVAWQRAGGRRLPVGVRYSLAADGAVGFALARHDPSLPLVIEAGPDARAAQAATPALTHSTYLGGTKWDEANDVEVDARGNAYVTGFTLSPEFPTRRARQRRFGEVADAFVAKLSANGRRLVYSTYLGGRDFDVGNGIAVDRAGNAHVTGRTRSDDFPVTSRARQRRLRGRACQPQGEAVHCHDAFVAKLSRSGAALRYSTYLGGRGNDEGWAIAVDRAGAAHVTGNTSSPDFPRRNAFQSRFRGRSCPTDLPCPNDAFVSKLSRDGRSLRYSTYLGGRGSEASGGIAVDRTGSAYVTGSTRSPDFPTRGARQRRLRGRACGPPAVPCPDAFVTKLRPNGRSLRYSTYLGGSRTEISGGIAVDSAGRAHVTGSTQSADFPTRRALQPAPDNAACFRNEPPQDLKELCNDAFVAALGASGRSLRFSSYLGGDAEDQGLGIALDRRGRVHVVGSTDSHDFPTRSALQPAKAGGIDAFAAKLALGGGSLAYSTYLGGKKAERSNAVAVDRRGGAHLAGRTESVDFPTAQPLQPAPGGDFDAFVARLR